MDRHGRIQVFRIQVCRDPWTAELVRIFKRDAVIHGPLNRSAFLKGMQDSTGRRIGPNFKSRIHGPLNRSEFLKGIQELTDRRIGPNLKSRIHGPLNRSEFLKEA